MRPLLFLVLAFARGQDNFSDDEELDEEIDTGYQTKGFSWDYCSFFDSSSALQQIEKVVAPVYHHYNVELMESSPFHRRNIENNRFEMSSYIQRKESKKQALECPRCSKQFTNLEFLELHLKAKHEVVESQRQNDKGETLKAFEHSAYTCLADFCDILECYPQDYKKRYFKTSTFKRQQAQTSFQSVKFEDQKESEEEEEDEEEQNFEQKRLREMRQKDTPFRVDLMEKYSIETKFRLEHECSSLFYSSMNLETSKPEDAIKAFDLLYQIFCSKFLYLDVKEEYRDEDKEDGRLGLLEEIKIWRKEDRKREEENESGMYVLKVILSVFGAIFVLLYYCAVYFSIYDREDGKAYK